MKIKEILYYQGKSRKQLREVEDAQLAAHRLVQPTLDAWHGRVPGIRYQVPGR